MPSIPIKEQTYSPVKAGLDSHRQSNFTLGGYQNGSASNHYQSD
jgi:hypothetical protein